MNNRQYPYIQDRQEIKNFVCDVCKKQSEHGVCLEWRVDWFQGNCEFEKICDMCGAERHRKEIQKEKEREAYEEKMFPIWEAQRQKREEKARRSEQPIYDFCSTQGIEIKKYDNGQWSFGSFLDWWTTTGTAIERKSRKRHHLSFKEPDKIIKVLTQTK